MDPIAIVIITILVLAFGGSTATAIATSRQTALRKALQTPRYLAGANMLSLFDVFWDLGASDYALEMMAQQNLLPSTVADFTQSYSQLEELIQQHGSYHEYIEDTLAAIETYYKEHRLIGPRRQTAQTLQLQHRKKLLTFQRNNTENQQNHQTSTELTRQNSPKPQKTRQFHDFQSVILDFSLSDRQFLRNSFHQETTLLPGSLVLHYDPLGQIDFDLDQITGLDVSGVLTMLFGGTLSSGLQKWWKMRRLRTLKTTLDQHLTALYELFASHANQNPGFAPALYHSANQWRLEAGRLQTMRDAKPAAGQDWELPANILLSLACELADELAEKAYSATRECLDAIRHHGQTNKPMAGYLIFLNQHAFFAGRVPNYAKYTNSVESAAYHIREELNKLHRQGVL